MSLAHARRLAHSILMPTIGTESDMNLRGEHALELARLVIELTKQPEPAAVPERVSPGTNAAVLEVTVAQLRAIVDHCDPPAAAFPGGGSVILGIPARVGEPLVIVPNGTLAGEPAALDIERESTQLFPIAGHARDRARDAVVEQGLVLDDLDLSYVPPAYVVFEGYALYIEKGDLMYASLDTAEPSTTGHPEFRVARCVEDEFLQEVPPRIREALGALRQAVWALVPRLEDERRPVSAA